MSGDPLHGGRGATVEVAGRDRAKFFGRAGALRMDAESQTPPPRPVTLRPLAFRPPAPATAAPSAPPPPRRAPRSPAEAAGGGGAGGVGAARSVGGGTGGGAGETTATVGVQTAFRESDTQTDPYTPDYVVAEGAQPEVLALADLKWNNGLPAGAAEVNMIDRIRRRREVEAALPQGTDEASMQQRLQALESLEALEWSEREAHIRSIQDIRLHHLGDALKRREEHREAESKKRVEAVRTAKLAEVEAKLAALQHRRVVITRQLTARHANPCAEVQKRDTIQRHVLYGPRSEPVKSNTLVERVDHLNYDVRPTLLTFPEGVGELERSAAPRLTAVKSTKLQPPDNAAIVMCDTQHKKRKAAEELRHLDYASTSIEASHRPKERGVRIHDLYRATPRLQRPDTPTLVLEGERDEQQEEAALLLQRLLRGRAVQNDFFEGKERCHGLIEELQAASNAKDAHTLWLPQQEEERFRARQEAEADAVIHGVVGDVVFGTLDYLFKELQRQRDIWAVDCLRQRAEAARQEREAVERRRRENERNVRRREEIQFQQVRRVTSTAVDTFLGMLFTDVITTEAERHALRHQTALAKNLKKEPQTTVEREVVVCELLDRFVIPHVAVLARGDTYAHDKALVTTVLEAADSLCHKS